MHWVFLLYFLVTYLLFKNRKSGLLAAILFAVSFEQSQYALFIGHPSLAVVAVLLFYLGLVLLLLEQKPSGLILAALGMGLSIQFHFSMLNLVLVFLFMLIVFRRRIPSIPHKIIIISGILFLISVSTYILAEFKFDFQMTKAIIKFFFAGDTGSAGYYPKNIITIFKRFVSDNIISFSETYIFLGLLIPFYYFCMKKKLGERMVFILIWMVAGALPYVLGRNAITVYYYSIGGSISVIVITSYVLSELFDKKRLWIFGLLFFVGILVSNLRLINRHNRYGTIPEINVQDKMLLSDEIQVIDYMYAQSEGEEFSVNALTVPYNINTTWSYLLEWYGLNEYGYLPIWGGDAALGFEGNIQIIKAQSELPQLRFTISEPKRGIPGSLIEEFFVSEDNFWEIKGEEIFGALAVQKRIRK